VPVPVGVGEADLVTEVESNRRAYRTGLEQLVAYYSRAGNNTKYEWAIKELDALKVMPKYNYIPEVIDKPINLKATTPIPAADDLYYDALDYERKAGRIRGLKNQNLLRLALEKYNRLIREHDTSDKIDDAAFNAGVINEEFKDYSIALVYFQRAYYWDPDTANPARFRAARILDRNMHRYSEALELYQQAVATEGRRDQNRQWKDFAEKRIRDLQKLEEGES
jgi:tetratricopeptide (TPR) repeat protein